MKGRFETSITKKTNKKRKRAKSEFSFPYMMNDGEVDAFVLSALRGAAPLKPSTAELWKAIRLCNETLAWATVYRRIINDEIEFKIRPDGRPLHKRQSQ